PPIPHCRGECSRYRKHRWLLPCRCLRRGARDAGDNRKQCVESRAPLPPTTNRSWDVARHVLSRRHGSREGGCQVSENLGEVVDGRGAESIDGLLCNLAPGRLQLRQECPAPAAELDDRGAPVGW